MTTQPPEARYYDMQMHSLMEERDICKARAKVLEEENRVLKEKLFQIRRLAGIE